MKLIVGLGNPGKKYDNTRHNVGFEVLGELARRYASSAPREKFSGQLTEVTIEGRPVTLVRPLTFMNESGRCVRAVLDFYKLPTSHLLVVCDDFHLPTAKLRFRRAGSAGGQKGLQSIIQAVQHRPDQQPPDERGSKQGKPETTAADVCRLRLGVGPVPERWNPADFVLGRFSRTERESIDDAILRAADGVAYWVTHGIEPSMNQFN